MVDANRKEDNAAPQPPDARPPSIIILTGSAMLRSFLLILLVCLILTGIKLVMSSIPISQRMVGYTAYGLTLLGGAFLISRLPLPGNGRWPCAGAAMFMAYTPALLGGPTKTEYILTVVSLVIALIGGSLGDRRRMRRQKATEAKKDTGHAGGS